MLEGVPSLPNVVADELLKLYKIIAVMIHNTLCLNAKKHSDNPEHHPLVHESGLSESGWGIRSGPMASLRPIVILNCSHKNNNHLQL